MNKQLLLALMGITAAAGITHAATNVITGNITTSSTWTSNDVYQLDDVVYI